MLAELANLSDCAVPILSRTAVNLHWYYYTTQLIDTLDDITYSLKS